MSLTFESRVASVSDPCDREDADLLRRIEAEFREMPGLNLTLSQAARLFSLDLLECERALQTLVHRGRLRLAHRSFALAGDGPARFYVLN
jgi:hypothetical protein